MTKATDYHSNFFLSIIALFVQISAFAQTTIYTTFEHYCNGKPVAHNTFIYKNAQGTTYQINQIQYFISNISYRVNGKWICDSTITYIDAEKTIPMVSTTISKKKNKIDSIRFTVGLPTEQNIPYRFTNPEWAQMYWPESMGGGYHYLKLNIKYINNHDTVGLFNCHLGRSMEMGAVIDNDFTLTLPYPTETHNINVIRMNVDAWFVNPNTIDFNLYTKGIMGKQSIMHAICENGKSAFAVMPKNFE
ncbi:MAG: hypothetical protein J6Y55_02305 [Bacteroidales bacterium]|nr:hypothetical protein [Bacteroidales bacterium]